MKFNYKLGVIGYGNMAHCIVERAVQKGLINKTDILICDTDKNKLDGDFAFTANCSDVSNCEYILLSVKPQSAAAVFENFCGCKNTVLSIMAGVTAETIERGMKNVDVVRCMPNTPCLIGEGAIAVSFNNLADDKRGFIRQILAATGKLVEVEESEINAVTSVSGSGPAYFYYFIKTIIDAGIKNGLDEQTAKVLAIQTAKGSAIMLESSNESVETLIERVCSKGGTTIEAINSFKHDRLDQVVYAALKKCYDRAFELEGKG